MSASTRNSRLFVVSGPSGVGKGTLVALARKLRPNLGLTVSATTRPPRPGEEDGVSYHFFSDEQFDSLIAEDGFLEWANVHGNRYGTPLFEVERLLSEGRSIVLEIDVQGGLAVRQIQSDVVLIFVAPPSLEVLEQRLRERGTEDEKTIQLRLANAKGELELSSRYDKILVNDDLETAAHELLDIIDAYERN